MLRTAAQTEDVMSLTAGGSRTWLSEADCDLDDFRALVEQVTDPRDHPLAESVDRNIPFYDGDRLCALATTAERRGSRDSLRGPV